MVFSPVPYRKRRRIGRCPLAGRLALPNQRRVNGMLTMRASLANRRPWRANGAAHTKRARTGVRAKSNPFAMKQAATGCSAMPGTLPRHRKLGSGIVVGGFAVRGEVEAFALGFRSDTQADDDIDDLVEDRRADAAPQDGGDDGGQLHRDLAAHGDAIGVADAAERGAGEDAGCDGSEDTADAVYAEDVGRIVIAELVLHDRDEEVAQRRDDEAHDDRAHRTGDTGSRRDGDETGNHARSAAEHGGLAAGEGFDQRPGDDGGCGCDEGVYGGEHRTAGSLKVRAGIEAEPADPEHGGADHGQCHGMRGHHVLAEADALADEQGADDAGNTGIDVNDGAACEVEGAHLEQHAVGIPDHMGDREVDEGRPQRAEEHGCAEFDAFGKSADDQGRRNGGESHLEQHEDEFRNDDALGESRRRGRGRDAREEHLRRAAPIGAGAAAEGEGIAIDDPEEHHDRADHGALHQDGKHVLRAHEAAIEQRKTRHEHEQHEDGGDEHEGGVALVRHRRCSSGGGGRRRSGFLCEGDSRRKQGRRKHTHPCQGGGKLGN
ncbi:hypothetical protein RHSP_42204 [Rhizobium freirei PRF 81]|uniref:Uncharacterized protein n=1 Tax=Rhizobium freirei PRF 81 TaxID=363754 RepID=N6V170_9HYPH|nr:hypothetical protein RHSP_42204 [Rhizobium freirei PRF 81]